MAKMWLENLSHRCALKLNWYLCVISKRKDKIQFVLVVDTFLWEIFFQLMSIYYYVFRLAESENLVSIFRFEASEPKYVNIYHESVNFFYFIFSHKCFFLRFWVRWTRIWLLFFDRMHILIMHNKIYQENANIQRMFFEKTMKIGEKSTEFKNEFQSP